MRPTRSATAEAAKAGRLSRALESLFDMSNPALAADAKSVTLREVIERTEADLAADLLDLDDVTLDEDLDYLSPGPITATDLTEPEGTRRRDSG